jgi:hypothetical protein
MEAFHRKDVDEKPGRARGEEAPTAVVPRPLRR